MYSFVKSYNKDTNNTFKLILDDKVKTKIVFINIYKINDFWYLDVLNEDKSHILSGRRILSYTDIFEVLRNRFIDFPNLQLKALPIKTQGFDKEFINEVPGVLQDLLVVD